MKVDIHYWLKLADFDKRMKHRFVIRAEMSDSNDVSEAEDIINNNPMKMTLSYLYDCYDFGIIKIENVR